MKELLIEDIKKIHAKYSLNIEKLIRGIEKTPSKYQIISAPDENYTQTILISKNGEQVLLAEFSNEFITILEPKSELEYRILFDTTESTSDCKDKIYNFEVAETFGKTNEVLVNLAVIIDKNNESICFPCEGGNLTWFLSDGKKRIEAEIIINIDYEDEDIIDDEGIMDEDEDIMDDEDSINDDDNDEESINEDFQSQDYEEIQDVDDEFVIDELITEFKINGKLYEGVDDKDIENIEKRLPDILVEIADDFDKRMNEIIRLKKGISKVLKPFLESEEPNIEKC